MPSNHGSRRSRLLSHSRCGAILKRRLTAIAVARSINNHGTNGRVMSSGENGRSDPTGADRPATRSRYARKAAKAIPATINKVTGNEAPLRADDPEKISTVPISNPTITCGITALKTSSGVGEDSKPSRTKIPKSPTGSINHAISGSDEYRFRNPPGLRDIWLASSHSSSVRV